MTYHLFYFIGSYKIICTSGALPILFSDVQGHYFKDHHSYLLFGYAIYHVYSCSDYGYRIHTDVTIFAVPLGDTDSTSLLSYSQRHYGI